MIESSCHCGNVKLKIEDEAPESLTLCNCSICSKYGSIMAYFPEDKVTFDYQSDSVIKYVWGDKSLEFVNCNTCGCYVHWYDIRPDKGDQVGVNARLFSNIDINNIRVRRFDGADTWKFLD